MPSVPLLQAVESSCLGGGRPENLLKARGGRWVHHGLPCSNKRKGLKFMQAEFKIPSAKIERIDLGNYWSSAIEISVSSSSSNVTRNLLDYKILLSRGDSNTARVGESMIFLGMEDFCQDAVQGWWDLIKITCYQMYRKETFGISALIIHGETKTTADSTKFLNDKSLNVGRSQSSSQNLDKLIAKASIHASKMSPWQGSDEARTRILLERAVRSFLANVDPKRERKIEDLKEHWVKVYGSKNSDQVETLMRSLMSVNFNCVKGSPSFSRDLSEKTKRLRESDDLIREDTRNKRYRNALSSQDTSTPVLSKDREETDSAYANNQLILMSNVELREANIQYQCHFFQSDRLIPLRNGTTLKVKRGRELKCYSKENDPIFFYKGKMYQPNLSSAQLEKFFRNYSYDEISGCKQHELSQVKETECPICQGVFPSTKIEEHCSSCGLNESSTLNGTIPCPICGDEFDTNEIDTHARYCARDKFD